MIYSSRKLFALLFSLSLSLSLLFSSSHSVLIQSPTVRYSLPINNAKINNNNHFHSESSLSSSSSSINNNGEGIHLIHMSSSDHSFQSISAADYHKIKSEAEKNHEPLPFFTVENYSKNNNNEENQSTNNNNNAHHRLGKYSSNTNNNKHKFNTFAAPFPPTILTGCPTYTFWTSATIGSQTFKLLVDSGSSSLAVASSWCDSCRSDGVFPLYSPGTKSDQKAMVRYGDGSGWSGNVYTDTVSISTLKKVPLKIAAIMDTQNNFFPKTGACGGATKAPLGGNYQGILGLAFNNLAVAGTQSYFETAVASNAMSAVYAVQFCGRTGKLWLGGYDELYLAGPISTATVISKTFWTISMNDLSIGGQSLKLQTSDYGDVVVDSGSAMLVLPTLAFNSFVQTMESNTFFTNNFGKDFFTSLNRQCKTPTTATLTTADLNANLPKLTLTLVKSQQDGSVTTLSLNPVSSYIHEIILDTGATVYCPGVTSAQTLSPQTILGWSIMNQFVTIFDSTNSAVGFAASRYCDTLPPGITATYNWTKEGASDCLPCGATTGTQSQKVYCQEVNSGLIVADNKCKGTKPASTISCSPQSCGAATGTADVDDACQGIDCGNGKCVGGVCVCSGGFGGQNCDVPPGIIITNVTVPTKIGSKANVRWTFTGSFPDVSVFIFPNDPSRPFGQVPLSLFPTYIRRNAPNTGSFDWTVGMDLSGSIKVGVGYSNLVSFYSLQPLAIEDQCNAVDCGANGICNQGICQCKSGFTGSRCEINLCPVDQCNLRGVCNQGVCTCNDGFKGTRCEIDTRVCKLSCANGGVMDPTCTRCSCVGAWGEAGCRKCLLQCAANTQPDASCTQCVCTAGWGGIRCNVPFATVQLKLKDINVPSIIPPPNAQPELLPIAQLGLKTLKTSLQQDIAYALSIPADRVNISNTEQDTTTKNPNNPTAPNNLLLVTVQLLAVANAPASAVTGMVTMLQNQVSNITVFSDSPLGLGQMSYKVDLQFKIQYMRDQSADGGLLGDLQTTASRFWIFIIAGGGAILLGLGGVGYYRYRKRRRANMDKTVNQLSEVSLGTGNAAPVQRSGAKGYEMPTANAAFPKKNNTNNTGTTQQFTTKGTYPVAGTVGGRNGEWTIFYTSAGDPYWYNNQNGISVWEAPSDF